MTFVRQSSVSSFISLPLAWNPFFQLKFNRARGQSNKMECTMEKNEDFFSPKSLGRNESWYQPKQIFSFIFSLPLQRERIAGTKGNALFMLHDFWSPDSFRLFFPRILGEILGSSGFSFEFLEFATFFSERFTCYRLDGRWYMVWRFSCAFSFTCSIRTKSSIKCHLGYLWSPKAVVDKSDWFCLS